MKRLFLVLGTAVVVLPWVNGAKVHADVIQWSASASFVGPNVSYNGVQDLSSKYGGWAQIYLGSTFPATVSGTNSSSVVLADVGARDDSPNEAKQYFSGPTGDYSMRVTLTDLASGASGNLTFNGYLSGYLSTYYAALDNKLMGPTTQSLKLGSNLYTVSIGPLVPPIGGSTPQGNFQTPGTISASISVQPATSSTPEPSSLLLACLAVPPLSLARWLRRRKTVANNA